MLLMFVIMLLGRVESPLDLQLRDDTIVIEQKSRFDGQRDHNAIDFYDYFLEPTRRYEVAERLQSMMSRAAKDDAIDHSTWLSIERTLRKLPEEQQINIFEQALSKWDDDWTNRIVVSQAEAREGGEKLVLHSEQINDLVAEALTKMNVQKRERRRRSERRDAPPAPVIAFGAIAFTYIVAKGMTKRLG